MHSRVLDSEGNLIRLSSENPLSMSGTHSALETSVQCSDDLAVEVLERERERLIQEKSGKFGFVYDEGHISVKKDQLA